MVSVGGYSPLLPPTPVRVDRSSGRPLDTARAGVYLTPASISGTPIFDFQLAQIKKQILSTLQARGSVKAEHFYETLTGLPENMISTKGYRQALLSLESEGAVIVLNKDGSGTPAGKRKRNTLAAGYYVGVTH